MINEKKEDEEPADIPSDSPLDSPMEPTSNVVPFMESSPNEQSREPDPHLNGGQQPTNILEIECINPTCPMYGKGRKMKKVMAEPQLLNGLVASAIIYPHEIGITCNYCDAYYQLGIAGFQIMVNWGIQPAPRPNQVVLAPKIVLQ